MLKKLMSMVPFALLALLVNCNWAIAEGIVALEYGYVYTVDHCGVRQDVVGKGRTPAEAYKTGCLDSELPWQVEECTGTWKQTFGALGPQLDQWHDGPVQHGYFRYSYTRTFVLSSQPYCHQYDQTITATDGLTINRYLDQACPIHSHSSGNASCECDNGYVNDISPVGLKCLKYFDRLHDKAPSCQSRLSNLRVGDPIYPLTGSNTLEVEVGNWLGEAFTLNYDSRRWAPGATDHLRYQRQAVPSFGAAWEGGIQKQLIAQANDDGLTVAIQASRGAGTWVSFPKYGGSYIPDADINDNLKDADGGGWKYNNIQRGAIESYDASGRITSLARIGGEVLTYTYSTGSTDLATAPTPGLLIQVSNQFGTQVKLFYRAPQLISSILDQSGASTKFDYDSSTRLIQVNWPDGGHKQFMYENPNFPLALTGVLDENLARTTIFGYDAEGRANDTRQADGVNHYSATYITPPSWMIADTSDPVTGAIWRDYSWIEPVGVVITTPNGQNINFDVANILGMPHLKRQSQPAGSGCSATTSSRDYDAHGNVAWSEDFNGHRVCYANDLSRNLETSRVEGLAAGSSCDAVLAASAALPANSRKVTTTWHPVWRKAAQVAEPRRRTTNVYNGQPDPTAGGATAWCAPSNATLPDGSPIVVLCKQVEQATTDANGALGFSATVDASVPARVQQWTYNQYGQVLTAKDPLNNTTTNVYYADTTADHTMGDLATVTNALNQTVSYTKYNPAGQWLTMVDANGTTTTRTFDLRQRLKSISTAGLTTSYDYWPTGLLKTVTMPDASTVNYGYDDAHRLTSVTDSLGNKIVYTLDNSGNRTGETVTDPSGKLAKTLTRVPDALNRIQQISGRE